MRPVISKKQVAYGSYLGHLRTSESLPEVTLIFTPFRKAGMGHVPQCSWGQHTGEALWCSGAVAVSLCRTLSHFTQQQLWPKLSHCDHKCQGRMTTSCLSKYPIAICRHTKSRNPMNNLSVLINNYTREYVDSYQKPQTDTLLNHTRCKWSTPRQI